MSWSSLLGQEQVLRVDLGKTELVLQCYRGDIWLDGSADPEQAMRGLLAVPGIGSRTAALIAMRALRDPDALPESAAAIDLALRTLGERSSVSAKQVADSWRPWRGYAVSHLWAANGGAATPR